MTSFLPISLLGHQLEAIQTLFCWVAGFITEALLIKSLAIGKISLQSPPPGGQGIELKVPTLNQVVLLVTTHP